MHGILKEGIKYRLTNDRTIIKSPVGETSNTTKSQNFVLFVGKAKEKRIRRLLNEDEAAAIILEDYSNICDAMDFEREIVWLHEINTHNEISHLIDTIQKYGIALMK